MKFSIQNQCAHDYKLSETAIVGKTGLFFLLSFWKILSEDESSYSPDNNAAKPVQGKKGASAHSINTYLQL